MRLPRNYDFLALMSRHDPEDLITIFNGLFAISESTVLVRGGAEPLYVPAKGGAPAQVIFAHGFYASALHEVAHWCVAGPARRRLLDFGYWYKPDGRSAAEQAEFERVEVKPQALEWIFSLAAGSPFHFSADNLSCAGPSAAFKAAVHSQVRTYLESGLPRRAGLLAGALTARYGRPSAIAAPPPPEAAPL